MQPDDLQGIWRRNDDQIKQIPIDGKAIAQAKTQKTNDVIYQFRRTIITELAVSVVVSAVVLYWTWHTTHIAVILFLIAINIWYAAVVIDVMRRIAACGKQQSTRIYLQNVAAVLQGFVRHYKLVSYVIVPISAAVGVFWSVQNGRIVLNAQTYYVMGGVVLVVCALVFPFCYWWINYFYERKVTKIMALIQDLNNDDDKD